MVDKDITISALQIFHSIGITGDKERWETCERAYKKSNLTFDTFLSWVADVAEILEQTAASLVKEKVTDPMSTFEYSLRQRMVGVEIYNYIVKENELPSREALLRFCAGTINPYAKPMPGLVYFIFSKAPEFVYYAYENDKNETTIGLLSDSPVEWSDYGKISIEDQFDTSLIARLDHFNEDAYLSNLDVFNTEDKKWLFLSDRNDEVAECTKKIPHGRLRPIMKDTRLNLDFRCVSIRTSILTDPDETIFKAKLEKAGAEFKSDQASFAMDGGFGVLSEYLSNVPGFLHRDGKIASSVHLTVEHGRAWVNFSATGIVKLQSIPLSDFLGFKWTSGELKRNFVELYPKE